MADRAPSRDPRCRSASVRQASRPGTGHVTIARGMAGRRRCHAEDAARVRLRAEGALRGELAVAYREARSLTSIRRGEVRVRRLSPSWASWSATARCRAKARRPLAGQVEISRCRWRISARRLGAARQCAAARPAVRGDRVHQGRLCALATSGSVEHETFRAYAISISFTEDAMTSRNRMGGVG